MTREEHERLYELVQNPPPGSKMEAAKEHGVDLTLNLRSLTRTPAERVREMEAALRFAEELRHAAAHLDRCPPLTSFQLFRKGTQESHVSAQREYLHAQSGSSSLCISLAVGMHS